MGFFYGAKETNKTQHCLPTCSALSWVDPSSYISVTTTATACFSIATSWLFSKSSKYLTSQKWFSHVLALPPFRWASTSPASSSNATCLLVFPEKLHVLCFLLRFTSFFSLFLFSFRKCFLLYSIFCRTEASWLHCGMKRLGGANELTSFWFWSADG